MVVLLTVLQIVGSSHFPVQRLTYGYRKQIHYSIIDLLITTSFYIESWETYTSTRKLFFLLNPVQIWGHFFSWT